MSRSGDALSENLTVHSRYGRNIFLSSLFWCFFMSLIVLSKFLTLACLFFFLVALRDRISANSG